VYQIPYPVSVTTLLDSSKSVVISDVSFSFPSLACPETEGFTVDDTVFDGATIGIPPDWVEADIGFVHTITTQKWLDAVAV